MPIHTKLGCVFFVAICSAALLGGCGGDDAPQEKRFLVIFSQCNNAEPYRAAQNTLLTKLFAEYDDVELVIKDAQQDNSKQIAQIEDAIRLKPDVLIVAPNEEMPLTEVMGKAMDAGIPTICLERSIAEPHYTSYVRCDNFKIGQQAGEFIVQYLTEKNGSPKGKIVELKGLLGVEGEVNRCNGAAEVFEKYPDIEIVHTAVAGWLQADARMRMEEALSAQSEIDVVFGHNDPMAIGAYLAVREKPGRLDEMIFVGVDGLGGEEGGIKKVQDGILAATFYYPLCVDKAAEIANKILRDPRFKPEKEYTMESEMITPENAAEMYEKHTVD